MVRLFSVNKIKRTPCTKIPQTSAISIAVGTILKSIEDMMNVIPLNVVSLRIVIGLTLFLGQ